MFAAGAQRRETNSGKRGRFLLSLLNRAVDGDVSAICLGKKCKEGRNGSERKGLGS